MKFAKQSVIASNDKKIAKLHFDTLSFFIPFIKII